MTAPATPGHDLLVSTAELVDIMSVSHHEQALADRVEAVLGGCGHLVTERIEDSVVARTELGRSRRVVLAGHLDTVAPFDDGGSEVRGNTLWGLGAVDMKGGLAVFLDVATSIVEPAMDVTFVFYACEEVERRYNALGRLAAERPELLAADVAILGEPTGGVVEAGCQGTMRATVSMVGRRAHTARPFAGINAVHRLAPVLEALARYTSRRVVLDGCEYVEQVQAVGLEGGVANNVVPDLATVKINYRFAPDRDAEDARGALEDLLEGYLDVGAGDRLEVSEITTGAPPTLDHPVLAELLRASGQPPRAKLGWTDVATFWQLGIPATNFGPGDPLLAHTPDEHVSSGELEEVRSALGALLTNES